MRISVRKKLSLVIASLIGFNVAIDVLAYAITLQNKQGIRRFQLDQQVLVDATQFQKFIHALEKDPSSQTDDQSIRQLGVLFAKLKTSVKSESKFLRSQNDDNPAEQRIVAAVGDAVRDYAGFVSASASLGNGSTALVSGGSPQPDSQDRMQMLDRLDALVHSLIESEIGELMENSEHEWRLAGFTQLTMFWAIVASLLAATMSIVVLVRAVRIPLEVLNDGARAFGAGRLHHRIRIDGSDEFARLASTMNAMADELAGRRAQLELQSTALQTAVEERTHELRLANQQLESTSALRRRFLAEVGHELRTPLMIIRGESEVALRNARADAAVFREALSRILEQTNHTTALVNDLLFVAASEAGHAPLTEEVVDLGRIVSTAVDEMGVQARERGITLGPAVVADDRCHVLGDNKHLKRLILILLDNAIAYSPQGASVAVTVTRCGAQVRLTVRDEGCGIGPEEQARVFERYYRGSNAEQYNPDGTGLGLPMAKAIVEAHRGAIRLSSEIGRGTTIDAEFPSLQI